MPRQKDPHTIAAVVIADMIDGTCPEGFTIRQRIYETRLGGYERADDIPDELVVTVRSEMQKIKNTVLMGAAL